MEAATTPGSGLLPRDGSVPAVPSRPGEAGAREAIDGVVTCSCCGRFPLLGELVIRHEGRRRAGWVCQCCEDAGRARRLGAITGRARVRSLGGAMNVRRLTDAD